MVLVPGASDVDTQVMEVVALLAVMARPSRVTFPVLVTWYENAIHSLAAVYVGGLAVTCS